ncbi:MAG: hypothetical protein QG635_694 [Bacteroidota bacterium]|nr:hypothetical protein [Bacteroidota bacterium]
MKFEKSEYIKYLIEKSNTTFEDSVFLANGLRWNSATNRLYYSAFYCIRALLSCIELSPKTHKGVKNMFYLHFISKDLFESKYSLFFSQLFDARQESDYVDYIIQTEESVALMLVQTLEFIDVISRYIKENYLNQIDG